MMICLKSYLFAVFSMTIWKLSIQNSPIHNINLFEGDILGVEGDEILQYISEKNYHAVMARSGLMQGGAAIGDAGALWPNGTVYYEISDAFNSTFVHIIERAFDAFHNNTCVRLIKRTTERDYIKFVPGDGCSSYIGRKGKDQELILDSGCFNGTGYIIHEIMHALGFFHEHCRWDRDDYVTIFSENINADGKDNFKSYKLDVLQDLNTPYDYDSILHYSSNAFAVDSDKLTIVKKHSNEQIGEKQQLSQIDIQEINILYKCHKDINAPSKLSQTENDIRDSDDICWGTRFRSDYWSFRAINPGDCIKQCNGDVICGAIAFEKDVPYLKDNCYFYGALSNYTLIVDFNWKWGAWKKNKTFFECAHPKQSFQRDFQQNSGYQINVKTSDIYGAGTDANIFIQLIDTNGQSDALALKTSLQNVNKFERNSIEQFLFHKVSDGELLSINVWHDNYGFGAPWHLEYIEVLDNELIYRFQCNCWFSTTHDDKKISRNLRTTKVTINSKVCWGIRFLSENLHMQMHTENVNDCIRKCNEKANCEAISFNNDPYSHYNCFFFNSTLINYSSHSDLNLQWGVWKKSRTSFECEYQSKIQWGTRYQRYYKSLYAKQPNDCVKLCKNEFSCDAIAFSVAIAHPDANCFFVNIADKYANDTSASMAWGIWEKNTTYVKPDQSSRKTIQWGMHFTNHYARFKVSSAVNCKLRCKEDVSCEGMTFLICKGPCPANCFLSSSVDDYTMDDTLRLWGSWTKN